MKSVLAESYQLALALNAASSVETTLAPHQIVAEDDDDAVRKGVEWAAVVLKERGVDFATLQVVRNGVGVRSIPIQVAR